MNKRVKRAWIKALRSGKYKQGRGALRNWDNTYCCLGVLCDLYARRRLTPPNQKWRLVGGRYRWAIASAEGVLPVCVKNWAGLSDTDPALNGREASSWNDNEHAGFERIATLIEKHL